MVSVPKKVLQFEPTNKTMLHTDFKYTLWVLAQLKSLKNANAEIVTPSKVSIITQNVSFPSTGIPDGKKWFSVNKLDPTAVHLKNKFAC